MNIEITPKDEEKAMTEKEKKLEEYNKLIHTILSDNKGKIKEQ